ncbi:MAG: glycoside hydrolase family 5 protein [Lachnospiraceae bacterium]
MKLKKVMGIGIAALAAVLMFGGCAGTEETGQGGSAAGETSAEAVSNEGTTADVSEMSSIELTRVMGNGINLGNTMEAYGRSTLGTNADVSSYETFWGQPVTTQEMITGMKEAGFDSIRIPVAWTNMMAFETGDYTINPAYLDRVGEIIDYAYNADMYVIINDHWDGSWWGMFGSASMETREQAKELYIAMWTQIAQRYQDYDEHLIFESANEELGFRLNDTDVAADSGALSEAECYETTNMINQLFVDTVRGTGGNNANRFLLIAGFGTDINSTVDDRFVMPTDTATDKLLISVHYYDPSGYCIMDSVDRWGYRAEYEYMNAQLAKMTRFTDAGYGVVIGEYGALPVNGVPKEDALEYTINFLDNCDIYGYAPMLWDTNSGNYDKQAMLIRNSKMREMYLERSYAAESAMGEEYLASVRTRMEENLANAEEGYELDEEVAMAWIMYNSSDWSVSYSVGDKYDPNSKTSGIVATDVEITGPGTYTVGLDFTGINGGYAQGTVFSALAIGNGETLYPDYLITIDEILINGQVYEMTADGYTASDDGICTRVNLYNQWVTQVPEDIRVAEGVTNPSPMIVNPDTLGNIQTLEITFTYGPKP